MTRLGSLALVSSIGVFGCGHIVVDRVAPGKAEPANGVLYALPNTVVRVNLKIDKTDRSCVAWDKFAGIFVPGSKAACKNGGAGKTETAFGIKEGLSLATYGEPDPENIFIVRYTGGGLIDQALTMTWTEAGLLTGAASTVTNRSVDVAMSAAKLAVGVGTKDLFGDARPVKPATPRTCSSKSANDDWIIAILAKETDTSADDLIEGYCALDAAKVRSKFAAEDKVELTEAARFYGTRIVPLVKAKYQALTGGRPVVDVAGLVARIDDEIARLLAARFLGAKNTTSWEGAFDVRAIEVAKPARILRLNKLTGICKGPGAEFVATNKAYPEAFESIAACDGAEEISLSFDYHPAKERQLFTHITDNSTGERSFRYRLPAQVLASVRAPDALHGAAILSVAQLGTVVSLPSSMRSKSLVYDLAFVESTGGLKTFKLGTTGGIDAATVDSLAGVAGTLADYKAAQRKAQDEVATLTREQQILKLKDEICTLQKKNGLECSVTFP